MSGIGNTAARIEEKAGVETREAIEQQDSETRGLKARVEALEAAMRSLTDRVAALE